MLETDLDANLDGVADRFEARVEEQMLKAVKDTEDEALAVVPVDTGRLKSTIESDLDQKEVTAGGETAPYAIYVHEGTYKMEARPFLRRPALKAHKRAAERLRDHD